MFVLVKSECLYDKHTIVKSKEQNDLLSPLQTEFRYSMSNTKQQPRLSFLFVTGILLHAIVSLAQSCN